MIDAFLVLLKPLAAAWDQEFGPSRSPASPRPSEKPVKPIEFQPEPPPGFAAGTSAEAEFSAIEQPAEPLYVRRGAGRGCRYDVAGPGVVGQRYRMLVKGGKRRFTPVEADR